MVDRAFSDLEAAEFWFGWRLLLLFNEQIPNGCMGEHFWPFLSNTR